MYKIVLCNLTPRGMNEMITQDGRNGARGIMKDRIIELLGNGIPATNVAEALGVSDSYISQIMSEEGVMEQVQAKRAVRFSKFADRDDFLEQAEEAALKRAAYLIPFMTKAGEAARVYSMLNNAKRKTSMQNANTAAPSTIVNLNIPTTARVNFTMSSDKQVIEVAGRSMVTMPAKTLAQKLEERNTKRMLEMAVPTELIPKTLVATKL